MAQIQSCLLRYVKEHYYTQTIYISVIFPDDIQYLQSFIKLYIGHCDPKHWLLPSKNTFIKSSWGIYPRWDEILGYKTMYDKIILRFSIALNQGLSSLTLWHFVPDDPLLGADLCTAGHLAVPLALPLAPIVGTCPTAVTPWEGGGRGSHPKHAFPSSWKTANLQGQWLLMWPGNRNCIYFDILQMKKHCT